MAAEGMEVIGMTMKKMDLKMETMDKDIEAFFNEMEKLDIPMKTITPDIPAKTITPDPGLVPSSLMVPPSIDTIDFVHKERFGASKKLAKVPVDALDRVHLIREYHAVTWEQIRTLYILPLWFVNKEKLCKSEK